MALGMPEENPRAKGKEVTSERRGRKGGLISGKQSVGTQLRETAE